MEEKKEVIDYEKLLLTYLRSYGKEHKNLEERTSLVDKILQEKPIKGLPSYLQEVSPSILASELAKIVMKQSQIHSGKKNAIVSYIFNPEKHYFRTTAVAALATAIAITGYSSNAITIGGGVQSVSEASISVKNLDLNLSGISIGENYILSKDQNVEQKQSTVTQEIKTKKAEAVVPTAIPTEKPVVTSTPNSESEEKQVEDSSEELDTMLSQVEEEEKSEKKQTDKEKILNNFSKCKTIDSILKRQKELESLGLTKKDKLYKDCKLSAPLQRFIYEQSVAWGITSPDFTFAIIDTETRGGFHSSGSCTHNKRSNTNDLGLTQQNDYWRVIPFAQAYKIKYKDAKKLVQYNDYVNIVSACLEYQEISWHFDQFIPNEYAGYYNSWTEWKQDPGGRYYVRLFKNAYNNKYTKYHKVETLKKTAKGKNKVIVKSK